MKKLSGFGPIDLLAKLRRFAADAVEATDKSSGKRRQKIHVSYDLVGFIPLDSLAKQETT